MRLTNRTGLAALTAASCVLLPTSQQFQQFFALADSNIANIASLESAVTAGDMARLAPRESSEFRKYAPNRDIDILNLALDVTPDFLKRSVSGTATLKFQSVAFPLREVRLDAVDLHVSKLEATAPVQGWQSTGKELVVSFAEPIAPGKEITITVQYEATPTQGLYFRTPEMGYPATDTHLFSQGEATEARYWFPCFDAPNERFTSEVTCHVPKGMTAVSNGSLVSEKEDAGTGLVAFHWKQDKPHVTYLIALAAGNFQRLESKYRDIPLTFYTPPSEFAYAASSFKDTADMMGFFEKEIGVPYAWDKYGQVCVSDFVAGGMENTSLTILMDGTLFSDESENIRSSEGLVAHELAHQWFGDLATCKDWSHLWLNEGFATYYAHLYAGYKNGRDQFLYEMYGDARGFLDTPNDIKPIVYREYDAPMEQFSFLAYPKGGWVLHMLRSQLGETFYRQAIKTYLERHRFGIVTTPDLQAVFEEITGKSLDQFFDQYVYHAHHPELEISYSWDESTHLAKINVKQNQALSPNVLLFSVPLPVRFKCGGTNVDRTITVKEKEEDFHLILPGAPSSVRVDPDLTLLAKIRFTPSHEMMMTQLADTNDVIGRILAVQYLGGRKDAPSITRLRKVLNEDPFYGVRLEASRALRGMHTPESLQALLDSTNQPDARVRQEVRRALRGFYDPKVTAAALAAIATEKNPDVLGESIAALRLLPAAEAKEHLIKALNTPSFRNELADDAIGAMRSIDDPIFVEPIKTALEKNAAAFTTHSYGPALRTLGRLARHDTNREPVREFLLRHLQDKRRSIVRAAIDGLGSLGDPKAIPALETFTQETHEGPEKQAADAALGNLYAEKKPSVELQDLRREFTTLQQQNRDIRREWDALKKQFDSLAPAIAGAKPKADAAPQSAKPEAGGAKSKPKSKPSSTSTPKNDAKSPTAK